MKFYFPPCRSWETDRPYTRGPPSNEERFSEVYNDNFFQIFLLRKTPKIPKW